HTLTCSTTHPLTSTLFPYTTLFRSPLHPREPGPYWHPYRVRYVELWRVHGPARWPGHQVLHAADRAGGWLRGRDGRRPGAERSAARVAGGLLPGARPAMRVLYARYASQ